MVEGDVWHSTPDMLDCKYQKSYKMSFMAFEHLVAELTPFLCPIANMFVRPPIPIRKHVSLVVYRLAHGFSCKAMDNLYGLTPMPFDFFNRKIFHSVLLQVVCNLERFF